VTNIQHYVSSINHQADFVWVKFKEVVSNDSMRKYIEDAQKAWKQDGMQGKMPIEVIAQLREQRFKNEFEMKFPFIEWAQRDLKIHDKVEIDMPLQLVDIKSVGTDEGI